MNSPLKHSLIALATAALSFSAVGCKKDAEAPAASEASSGAEAPAEGKCAAGKCAEGKCEGKKGASEASCGEGTCGKK